MVKTFDPPSTNLIEDNDVDLNWAAEIAKTVKANPSNTGVNEVKQPAVESKKKAEQLLVTKNGDFANGAGWVAQMATTIAAKKTTTQKTEYPSMAFQLPVNVSSTALPENDSFLVDDMAWAAQIATTTKAKQATVEAKKTQYPSAASRLTLNVPSMSTVSSEIKISASEEDSFYNDNDVSWVIPMKSTVPPTTSKNVNQAPSVPSISMKNGKQIPGVPSTANASSVVEMNQTDDSFYNDDDFAWAVMAEPKQPTASKSDKFALLFYNTHINYFRSGAKASRSSINTCNRKIDCASNCCAFERLVCA